MEDLTQDTQVRKLVADAEALVRRVNKLRGEVTEQYRASALMAIAQMNRDLDIVLHAYNEWNPMGVIQGAEALLQLHRNGFEELQPYPYGSKADMDITELAEALRLDRYQVQRSYALTSA